MNVAVPVPPPTHAADCADRAHAGRLRRRARRLLPAHPEGQPASGPDRSASIGSGSSPTSAATSGAIPASAARASNTPAPGASSLIGFMIALAVLAPIYVVYFVLGLAAERLQAFASLPLFLILYVFGQYAAYRARRYRATRTIFRGVRFWMTGSAWRYAGKTFLWDLATLSLARPRAAVADGGARALQDAEHPLRRSRRAISSGPAATLFRRGVGLWILAIGLPVAAGVLDDRRRRSPARRASSCRSPASSRRSRSFALPLAVRAVPRHRDALADRGRPLRRGRGRERAAPRHRLRLLRSNGLAAVLGCGAALAAPCRRRLRRAAGGSGLESSSRPRRRPGRATLLEFAGVLLFYLVFLLGVRRR